MQDHTAMTPRWRINRRVSRRTGDSPPLDHLSPPAAEHHRLLNLAPRPSRRPLPSTAKPKPASPCRASPPTRVRPRSAGCGAMRAITHGVRQRTVGMTGFSFPRLRIRNAQRLVPRQVRNPKHLPSAVHSLSLICIFLSLRGEIRGQSASSSLLRSPFHGCLDAGSNRFRTHDARCARIRSLGRS